MSHMGDRIRIRREELNMSQDELAKRLGYKSRSSITKIEKDGRDVPKRKIDEIAKVLMTTPAYIMGWDNNTGKNSAVLEKKHIEMIRDKDLNELFDYLKGMDKEKRKIVIALTKSLSEL